MACQLPMLLEVGNPEHETRPAGVSISGIAED